MNLINANYQKQSGVNIKCFITSVDSASSPFEIEVNSTILVFKDNNYFNRNISQKISILGSYFPKKISTDPDGFVILCYSSSAKNLVVSVKDGKISYGSSLKKYLSRKGLWEADIYENASSPLYIINS